VECGNANEHAGAGVDGELLRVVATAAQTVPLDPQSRCGLRDDWGAPEYAAAPQSDREIAKALCLATGLRFRGGWARVIRKVAHA
jgi:hypothetical protein